MFRRGRWLALVAGAALTVAARPALAQDKQGDQQQALKEHRDKCQPDGNHITRGADVELSYASRPSDPKPKEDRYHKAIEILQEAFQKTPDAGKAYLDAGEAYLGLRQYAQADSMFDRLVKRNPECEDYTKDLRYNAWVGLYNSAIQKYRAGDQSAALDYFMKANTIYDDVRSLNNAASLYQQMDSTSQAIELYRRAATVGGDPDQVRAAMINRAELLKRSGKADSALAIYAEYTQKHPDDALGDLNYAIALADAGKQDSAQAIFQGLLSRTDLNFDQWDQVGIGLYKANAYDKAAEAFGKAHQLVPENKEVLQNLGNSLAQANDYDHLIPVADTLVEWFPYERSNYNVLANAYANRKENKKAMQLLQRRQDLPFEFLSVQMVPQSDSQYVVKGQAMGRAESSPGQVQIPFHFLGKDGSVVTTEPLALDVPAKGETANFELRVSSDQPLSGFRYDLAAGSGSAGAGSGGAAGQDSATGAGSGSGSGRR